MRGLVFWMMMNQPHSRIDMYLRKFLWPTLISSLRRRSIRSTSHTGQTNLWSLFFSKTLPRTLLSTSPWIILTHLITSSSLSSSR